MIYLSIRMKDAYSLFINGLPLEMTWDWLMQIFRGEGEVTDVYVSQKRRRFNNYRFGFVRFKKLEEARNVVKNLNGARIRGRRIKVSFVKYDKNGMPWNDFVQLEADKVSESVGREEKYKLATK